MNDNVKKQEQLQKQLRKEAIKKNWKLLGYLCNSLSPGKSFLLVRTRSIIP